MVASRDQAVGGESGDSALDPRDWPGNNLLATGSMGRPGNQHGGVGGAREGPEQRGVPDGGEAGGARGVESRAAARSPGAIGVWGGAKKVGTRFPTSKSVGTSSRSGSRLL